MKITAILKNDCRINDINLATDGKEKKLYIPGKEEGRGSSVNGGELLFLSLATCICNDLYREAAIRKILLDHVEVRVTGEFGGPGEPGRNIEYEVVAKSSGTPAEQIEELIRHVDKIAEIHNTLRKGVNVSIRNFRQE